VLAVVHDPAHRRIGLRGHLDEVELLFAGPTQRLGQRDDPHLGAIGVDEPDARDLDVRVQPLLLLLIVDAAASSWSVRRLGRPLQGSCAGGIDASTCADARTATLVGRRRVQRYATRAEAWWSARTR
jgi:hypothetical protein